MAAGLILLVCIEQARAQQSVPGNLPTKTVQTRTAVAENDASSGLQDRAEPQAIDLIAQGKALYRTAKFRQALTKFEAALKLEADNDEALGLAAETAFRLDSQTAARDYFLRRAELPEQKESVKAYCYHRVAMTYWREARDQVAKYAEIEDGKISYKMPEDSEHAAMEDINKGIEYTEKTLRLRSDFADVYNIKNLLHAEAALAISDEEKAGEHRRKAMEELRMAISLAVPVSDSKSAEAADFNYPTIRISEFARSKEEEQSFNDPMMKMIEGGKPIRRVHAVFPSIRRPKTNDSNDPSGKGVTSDGGAYSLGTGRGALTAAYLPGTVKVEVLVSTTGKVIFTHIVDGRSDLNGAAIMAARSWTFEPARLDGQPVQISGVITFDMKPGRASSAKAGSGNPPKKP